MKEPTNKKAVFILIIVLLVLFLPLSILSLTLHIMRKDDNGIKSNNVNHEFYYEGSLYFYKNNGDLLGTYKCQNEKANCHYAKSSLDDKKYAIDSYKPEDLDLKTINNRYAFLIDGTEDVILYDIVNERKRATYQSVKNYGIGIEENAFIVENKDGKYGMLSLEKEPALIVPMEYDFLGMANRINEDENKIMNDFIIAKKGENWYLIDNNNATLTEAIPNEIVSYNGKDIIVKTENGYELIDYNNEKIGTQSYQKLSFTGKYLNVLDYNNNFTILDSSALNPIITPISVQQKDEISSKINEKGNLDIILNGKIIKTIDLP